MTDKQIELLDDAVRLLAVLVRRSSSSQRDAILEMSDSGMKPIRISELLGASKGTVTKEISRARSSGTKAAGQ